MKPKGQDRKKRLEVILANYETNERVRFSKCLYYPILMTQKESFSMCELLGSTIFAGLSHHLFPSHTPGTDGTGSDVSLQLLPVNKPD
jgi:hypothetical protein